MERAIRVERSGECFQFHLCVMSWLRHAGEDILRQKPLAHQSALQRGHVDVARGNSFAHCLGGCQPHDPAEVLQVGLHADGGQCVARG